MAHSHHLFDGVMVQGGFIAGWIEHLGKDIIFLAGQILGPNNEVIAKATSTGRWLPRQTYW